MDSRTLRIACDVAGFVINKAEGLEPCDWWARGWRDYASNDPALPAYVASLLVAKVTDLDDYHLREESFGNIMWRQGCDEPDFATDTQRIRAAMEVLRKDID